MLGRVVRRGNRSDTSCRNVHGRAWERDWLVVIAGISFSVIGFIGTVVFVVLVAEVAVVGYLVFAELSGVIAGLPVRLRGAEDGVGH
jgi:hypothetical protein